MVCALVFAMLVDTGVAQTIHRTISGVVTPIPSRHALCSPVGTWHLTAVHVAVGDLVTVNQCLGEMDPAMLPQQRAQAEWDSAKARIDVLLANLKVGRQNMERAICLHKTHSISQQEVDERTGAVQVLECELIQAKANERATSVTFAMAVYDFKHYQRILAPIAGEVVGVYCAVGMSARAEGKQIVWFEILDSSRVYVCCAVTPETAVRLRGMKNQKPPKPVELLGTSCKATVVAVPRMIVNGKVAVVLEADNPNLELVCGQEVKFNVP